MSSQPDMSTGFDVRREFWSLDLTHGRMPLRTALAQGRTLGPPGASIGWLDTETTGLAGGTGTYVFLIGIGTIEDGAFFVTQYFLADLGAEAAMLEAVGEHLRRLDALVTFNGTRFDLPLLQTRFLLSRRESLEERPHLDLMTTARRLWYRPLGGYSLARLEQMVLGVQRYMDAPGWLIPSMYVSYLRSGDTTEVEPVFAHNAQDLLSLLALHGTAGELVNNPRSAAVTVDWFGLGRLLDQRSDRDAALCCYEANLAGEDQPAARRKTALALARHYRRRGDGRRLVALWQGELEAGMIAAWEVLERLAMVWEWQMKDPARALALAQDALAHVDGSEQRSSERLRHRCARLRHKTQIRLGPAAEDRAPPAARLLQRLEPAR